MNTGLKEDMKLSIDKLMHKMAYYLLSGFNEESSNHLGFKCSEVVKDSAETTEDSDDEISVGTNLADAYKKEYNFDEPAMKKKVGEEDGTFECQVIVRMSNLVSATTIDLWKKTEDQEQQRETEAAIRLILEPC